MSVDPPNPPESIEEDLPPAAVALLASWLAELDELGLSESEPFSLPPSEDWQ